MSKGGLTGWMIEDTSLLTMRLFQTLQLLSKSHKGAEEIPVNSVPDVQNLPADAWIPAQ